MCACVCTRMRGCALQVYRLYDMLPVAVFVGTQPMDPHTCPGPPVYIQGCHGGIEVGWNPVEFLQVGEGPLSHPPCARTPP